MHAVQAPVPMEGMGTLWYIAEDILSPYQSPHRGFGLADSEPIIRILLSHVSLMFIEW